jgi:2-keto-4-pentenoate hydratase
MTDWPARFLDAFEGNSTFPNICAEEPNLTLDEAYTIQHAFAAKLPGSVVGYKAALTAAPAQKAMGISAPVSGALFDWGAQQPGALITSRRTLLLETELGYRLATDVGKHVTPATVLEHVETCHPMIEVASPNLASAPTGLDLIASNSASYGYIEGPGQDIDQVSIDAVTVSLARDGETLHEAASGSVMEGQARALSWLLNQILDLGETPRAGMLLMSGSVGPPHPGKPGAYHANFRGLGTIDFTLG